jgi:hypothetical protein
VASVFDLAVIAVAILVCISMALLAWTLGVTATVGLRRARRDVIGARLEISVAERRLRAFMRRPAGSGSRPEGKGEE